MLKSNGSASGVLARVVFLNNLDMLASLSTFQIDLYKNNMLFWYHVNKYREIYEDRMSHSGII